MFLFRKNIILVPTDYDGISSAKGLLSFDAYTGKTICTLRCYNIDFDKPLTLGVAIQKKLYKIKIDTVSQNINFDLNVEIKNNDNISAVLLDIEKDDYQVVLWGSTEINNSWQTEIKLMIERENIVPPKPAKSEAMMSCIDNIEVEQQEIILQDNKNEYQNDSQGFELKTDDFDECFDKTENENRYQNQTTDLDSSKADVQEFEIDDNLTCDKKLEEYIDKVIELSDSEEEFEHIPEQTTNDTPEFYQKLSLQIEKMFAENEQEKILSHIIPNSKFVKVDFDDGSGYYVFGVIYENDIPKYLCYGMPAKRDSKPPVQFADFYQWLPIDSTNQDDDGFYIMYQDAETGQNISVEII